MDADALQHVKTFFKSAEFVWPVKVTFQSPDKSLAVVPLRHVDGVYKATVLEFDPESIVVVHVVDDIQTPQLPIQKFPSNVFADAFKAEDIVVVQKFSTKVSLQLELRMFPMLYPARPRTFLLTETVTCGPVLRWSCDVIVTVNDAAIKRALNAY